MVFPRTGTHWTSARAHPIRPRAWERRLIADVIERAMRGSEKMVCVFMGVGMTIFAGTVPRPRHRRQRDLSNSPAIAG